jgi:hypothetical protein
MTYLLALDPGGSTGWSKWFYDETTPLTHLAHGTQSGGVAGFRDWWERSGPDSLGADGFIPDELVVESFVLDGRTISPDITPLRIEGALTVLWRGPIALQRNLYKRHAPDPLLREHGLYWRGPGHDRDAARHAVAYLVTRKHMPTLMWLHPPV